MIWAQRRSCVPGRKKIKHLINNTLLAFHTSHSLSISSTGGWHTNKSGHLSMDAWRYKGKVPAVTANPFPSCRKHQPGVLVSMASFWSLHTFGVCVRQREQGGLMGCNGMGCDGTGYKGYKRRCISGTHVNNSSDGKPCLKAGQPFTARAAFHFQPAEVKGGFIPAWPSEQLITMPKQSQKQCLGHPHWPEWGQGCRGGIEALLPRGLPCRSHPRDVQLF